MPTSTEVYVPTQATSNTVSQVLVTVSSQAGTFAPEGTVSLASGFGVPVGTQGLIPIAGSTSSYATFNWTPQILGPFPLVATYTPSSNATTASTSPTGTSLIVSNAGAVELRLPSTFRVGQPVALSALIFPVTTTGSAAFTLSSGYASGSRPVVNGVATAQWTPTVQGPQVITTAFTSTTPANISGRVTQAVNVLPALPADNISVSSPTGPWGPGRPLVITQGSNTLLTTSATSGDQVLLSENGPCSINGSVITGLGAGTCTVTAATVGGAGYSAASEQFIVTVQAKPKKKRR
jgi:hypothetical protein